MKRVDAPEAERAWDLIDAIAEEQGHEPAELMSQAEFEWSGPEARGLDKPLSVILTFASETTSRRG